MSAHSVKFNVLDRPEFYSELKKRINGYFKENNISKHANNTMRFKTVFMISLYFIPLTLMLTSTVSGLWPTILMWTLMGFGMSGIGLSIMHDANHDAYSKNRKVNNVLGFIIHIVGGSRKNWKIQHNVLHHSFTNVDDHDKDLEYPFLRMSSFQKRKGIHKYQAYYASILYALMTVYWSLAKDFEDLIVFNRMNLLSTQNLTFKKALMQIIFNKIWYFGLVLVLPLVFIDLPWYQIVIGFLLMHAICGLALALIFQSAHVIEETKVYKTDKSGSVENNWAIHQMNTTANFANNSVFFSWFIGGLNFQIEHHLFPNICHVHHKNISKIVKATANEFNVPYHEHKTFISVLQSHFSRLNSLGNGEDDQELPKVA
jgi:linoleoyl-CoA desaturase